jgi:hypothetical protein
MRMKSVVVVLSLTLLAACSRPAEQQSTTTTSAPSAAATTTTSSPTATAAPATASAPASTPAPATPPAGAIATQETNWKGVSATITEFRRKGNTLTAKVQLQNHGAEDARAEVNFSESYLIDTAAGKKYNVLKDEKDHYIASLRSGYNDRWYDTLKPGESYLLWMKFPAPPPETKAITLQIPNTPPFEDVNIQD